MYQNLTRFISEIRLPRGCISANFHDICTHIEPNYTDKELKNTSLRVLQLAFREKWRASVKENDFFKLTYAWKANSYVSRKSQGIDRFTPQLSMRTNWEYQAKCAFVLQRKIREMRRVLKRVRIVMFIFIRSIVCHVFVSRITRGSNRELSAVLSRDYRC